MGLTRDSSRANFYNKENKNKHPIDRYIAIAGNPNVGKSTIFNALTGMKQHTGNWPGKTVGCTMGYFTLQTKEKQNVHFAITDIPGTYSLLAHSPEEEIARDYLCFGEIDAIIIVCDAVCLERNLNLVAQILELQKKAVVCVNLLDEAEKKGIQIDMEQLSERLKTPVIGTIARKRGGLQDLLEILPQITKGEKSTFEIDYPLEISDAVDRLATLIKPTEIDLPAKWLSLRLLEYQAGNKREHTFFAQLSEQIGYDLLQDESILQATTHEIEQLQAQGYTADMISDAIAEAGTKTAESIYNSVCHKNDKKYIGDRKDRTLDHLFTGKKTAYPIMIALLAAVFWITISGANYPSALLSHLFDMLGDKLSALLSAIHTPPQLHSLLIDGAYRVLTWIVAVMLPPMAIFFPLFTLLEDSGYLPRIAFNLDKSFHKCNTCGKQALTMCMGFGCNAAGVVGCRIIDSPRERLIAILTNSLVPCNGRFPMLISIITMFFVGSAVGFSSSLVSALLLTGFILLSIAATLGVSKLMSLTFLRGMPSSFTLELPPYRRPQIGKVIVRSIFDRTVFVLGRAVISAIPAGILIWLMANLQISGTSLLSICSDFLDPFARLMGLDGVILIAFILGFPANEIVIPIMIMAYMSESTLTDQISLIQLKLLFEANGWTSVTAICTLLFSLMHWPCATTLLTIKKETGHIRWVLAGILIPTFLGIAVCMITNFILKILL